MTESRDSASANTFTTKAMPYQISCMYEIQRHDRNWKIDAPTTGPMLLPARYPKIQRVTGLLRSFSVCHTLPMMLAALFPRIVTHPPAKKRVMIRVAKFRATACGMTKMMRRRCVRRKVYRMPKSSMIGSTINEKIPPPMAQLVTGQYE